MSALRTGDEKDIVQRVQHQGAAFAELCQAYDAALLEWRNEMEGTDDPTKEQELNDAFSAIRDQIFTYRPASIAEVAEKATFLSTRWNDAEGLNPNRIQQLFASLGSSTRSTGDIRRLASASGQEAT